MFAFERWKSWLAAKEAELRAGGFDARLHVGAITSKPGMTLSIVGHKALGEFANWVTGETDYTVHEIRGPRNLEMVSHKWGLLLTDETFEQAFADFLSEFRRYELGDNSREKSG
jgi:hypothetical protein